MIGKAKWHSNFWLTLTAGTLLVVLVIILGLSFFDAIFEAQINSRKEFLYKQTELAAQSLEMDIRRFEDEGKGLISYLEDPFHELDDYDEELTSAARRFFNAYPGLIDTAWVDMQDSVLIFTLTDRNNFIRTQSTEAYPEAGSRRYTYDVIGKKGFRIIYSLNLIDFTKEKVLNYYLNPGGAKFMIFNDGLIDLSSYGSSGIEFSPQNLQPVLEDLSLGLKGLYELKWRKDGENVSGILAQYPFSFDLTSRMGTLVFLVPVEGLQSGIYGTYLLLFLGFVILLIFTIGFFIVSIKNNLEADRIKEENIREISVLFEQQNLLLQELRGFVFFHDAKGEITRVSDEVEEILGHPKSDFVKAFNREIEHQDVDQIQYNVKMAVAEHKDVIDLEYDYHHPDGRQVRLRVFEKLVYDEAGDFTGGMGICTDITANYLANLKIIESENRLRTLIGNIPDILFIYNNEGVVQDFHVQEKGNIFDASQATVGQKLDDFVPHGQASLVRGAFNEARKYGEMKAVDVKWESPMGERHYEIRFFPLDSDRMMSISKEITGQKIWEKGLVDAMKAADQASRAKSEFLANMSHEIRTPMNGLLGIIDLLEHTDLNRIQRQYVDIIKNSGNTLLSIIKDILDYSKIEAGKVEIHSEQFDPMDELEKQAQILSGLAKKKKIRFTIEKENLEPLIVSADRVKLNQIFLNLVGNAIKFTNEGGKVGVKLTMEPISEYLLFLKCRITDTGIGISQEHLEHLTDPFYQIESSSTRSYQGTGLGLAIAKKLIELMGGELEIESEVGQGSEFTFGIIVKKVSQGELEQEAKSPISWKEVREKGKDTPFKILVTEDNDLNLQLLELMLEQLGFEYKIAKNGLEAIEKVKEEDFDVVLMDVQMPLMNGLEASREIRNLPGKEKLIIIGLSANVFDDDKILAIEAGMNDYLTKPIRLAVLAEKLEFYLQKLIEKSR
ncbi:PAS domain-containing hybrid sensor histidine kinase/response regulator [Algoriphagus hitonicola]|uniref:Sensory/regulatory protein RpfC n=1 Tax=Algoriphagus hitonicola TaxID=435880 RepID=A0A1I2WJV8_9BACT|nr:PAS domain-containing hybrid sensor histidine kinase/response regulator [Algoriphagus hitonicola]SFH01592.1 PAS domain S-box-containing protein [Algoriphagus hitonicola]